MWGLALDFWTFDVSSAPIHCNRASKSWMLVYLKADQTGCYFLRQNRPLHQGCVCRAQPSLCLLWNGIFGKYLEFVVLGNASCDAERFNFKLHFPGGVTDLATHGLLRSHIPCKETMGNTAGLDLPMLVHSIVWLFASSPSGHFSRHFPLYK